uniref:Uncharacterized protein n=1 Tax=Ditylenchus dipsaci TaxID=166011 RepID=A0A915CUH1_9BILA
MNWFERATNDLCSHQKKINALDCLAGISMAGLLSDGRMLARKNCPSLLEKRALKMAVFSTTLFLSLALSLLFLFLCVKKKKTDGKKKQNEKKDTGLKNLAKDTTKETTKSESADRTLQTAISSTQIPIVKVHKKRKVETISYHDLITPDGLESSTVPDGEKRKVTGKPKGAKSPEEKTDLGSRQLKTLEETHLAEKKKQKSASPAKKAAQKKGKAVAQVKKPQQQQHVINLSKGNKDVEGAETCLDDTQDKEGLSAESGEEKTAMHKVKSKDYSSTNSKAAVMSDEEKTALINLPKPAEVANPVAPLPTNGAASNTKNSGKKKHEPAQTSEQLAVRSVYQPNIYYK